MKITILGCYSATPRKDKHTSSQLLEINGSVFLIDCGEGTQMQLRKAKIKFNRLNDIFISHLHGDHFYGLIGLISTFRLTGRAKPLNIYGPKGIKEIITLQLKLANSWTNYTLNFHELTSNDSQTIYEKDASKKAVTVQKVKDRGPLQPIVDMVPDNFFDSASSNRNMLQVVFVSIIVGISLIQIGKSKSNQIYAKGLCPVAEIIQNQSMCFKTNYRTLDQIKFQVEILNKLLKILNFGK